MNPDPQGRPSEAWRLVENRAALLRVGHQRTVASAPDPAAPRARPLRGTPGGRALCGESLGQNTRSKEDICRGDSQSVTIPDLLLGYPLPKRPSEDSA
jgi:hypothetical protein